MGTDNSICFGNGSTANYAFAMGNTNRICIGENSQGTGAVAVGVQNRIASDPGIHAVANYAVAMGNNNKIADLASASAIAAVAMGSGNTVRGNYAVAMGFDCSVGGIASFADGSGCIARGDYSVALGYNADTSNNYQFVVGISNENAGSGMATGGGNTFFIDNNQNVAMCVGGDLSFDISRCRSHLNVPVLDVSGDVRIRGICDPLGLGLINVSQADAIDIFNSMDSSRNAQLLFSNSDAPNELWHCFAAITVPHTTTPAKIGGGSSTGYWAQGDDFLTPEAANYGIKLCHTLIYGTDTSGLMVGDGNSINAAAAHYSVVMGSGNQAHHTASVAMGDSNQTHGRASVAMGTINTTDNAAAAAVAMGSGNHASGAASVAMGESNTTSGNYSVAMGHMNDASGICSVAMGSGNTTGEQYSVAMGHNNTAIGLGSVAMGTDCSAGGAFAMGGQIGRHIGADGLWKRNADGVLFGGDGGM